MPEICNDFISEETRRRVEMVNEYP